MMKQGPFSREGRRPLLFLRPFSGKQVPERSDYGKRAAGRVSGAVPSGRKQRRHQPGVGADLGIKGIEVRHLVNRLRRDGVPIASSGSGYFYAATEQEVRATIAHLTRRIGGIAAAIHGLNRSLERFDTGQIRLPLDGGDVP